MNTYELTILFPESKEGSEVKETVVKMIEGYVAKHKGEINKQENWGSKHLAYMIRKNTTAEYIHFVLTLEPADQVMLEKSLKLNETILRYMFVRV
ncbi:MAG: 30S ribosomal protein S6 [bacterium]